jgi:3-deoxy-D-manno-octulosonic-acid transferase
MLAEIYHATQLAYVGGGFSTGVHNVLEPSVTGQPVLLGPRHQNAPEVARLLELGAAHVVHDATQTRAALREWLDDDASRRAAGERARDFVRSQKGATERTLAMLEPFVFGEAPAQDA